MRDHPSSVPGSKPGKINSPVSTIFHRAHDDLRGFHLRGGQTVRAVGAAAREHGRVEAAARRILDQAILHTVEPVARIEHRLMDDTMLLLRNEARLILQHRLRHPDAPGVEAGLRIGGGAGDDAVEVVGESLVLQ